MITGQQLQNLQVVALTEPSSVTYKFKTKMSSNKLCVYVCICVRVCVCVRAHACTHAQKNVFYWNPINSGLMNR